MAKLNFKRLSRGVRLLTAHIHSQIQLALTRLTTTGVSYDNLESGFSTVRLTFSFPVAFPVANESTYGAVFNLPPPQNLFTSPQNVNANSISFILDSVSFSFDQRGAPYATQREGFAPAIPENTQNEALTPYMAFKLAIFGKRLEAWSTAAAPNTSVDDQVLSLDFPNVGFANADLRTNPTVAEGLGVVLSPFQSYVLNIDTSEWTGLGAAVLGQINSMTVSLVIKCRLIDRDDANADPTTIQNIPQSAYLPATSRYGGRYVVGETLTIPAAGSVIKADEDPGVDTGVQGSIETVDTKMLAGLVGGYTDIGRRHGASNILNDASYEIIAIPMWGNGWHVEGTGGVAIVPPATNNLPYLPYVGATPFSAPTCDRRIIPLHFPMVIHHVLAFRSYTGGDLPGSATLVNRVGVGIATGNRADSYNNREVAYAEWVNANRASFLIDTVITPDGVSGDLLNIPLVGTAALTGTGYDAAVKTGLAAQGRPVYVGSTTTDESARSQMADTPGGAIAAFSDIDGKEQWLEVRWGFEDPTGLLNMAAGDVQVGRGGHWVYIIGKKHLN